MIKKDKILLLINPLSPLNRYFIEQVIEDQDFIVINHEGYKYEIDQKEINLWLTTTNNEDVRIENFKNILMLSLPYNFDLFSKKIKENNIKFFNGNFLFSENVKLIRHKINQHIFFKENNIPFLDISNDFNKKNIDEYIYKLNYGSLGFGICLPKDLEKSKYKETMNQTNTFLEKYIKNKKDYRVMVINKKSLGVVYKENKDNEIVNYYSGAHFYKIDFSELEIISEKIANLLNLDFCAVDFIVDQDSNKIYVLEINFFAKFEGYELVYGKGLIVNEIKKFFYN